MITAALICNDIGSIDTVEFCSNLECSVGVAYGLLWIVPLSIASFCLFVVVTVVAMFLMSGFVPIFKVSEITLSKEQVMPINRRNLFLFLIIIFNADVI